MEVISEAIYFLQNTYFFGTSLFDLISVTIIFMLMIEIQRAFRAAIRYHEGIVDSEGNPVMTPKIEDHPEYSHLKNKND